MMREENGDGSQIWPQFLRAKMYLRVISRSTSIWHSGLSNENHDQAEFQDPVLRERYPARRIFNVVFLQHFSCSHHFERYGLGRSLQKWIYGNSCRYRRILR